MGKLMLNNINYTGGSGGTNVVPNPPETATDDLTSVKIDNTVYNLAGGGNVYGAFIDTTNILKPRTTYAGSFSYTATQDCAVEVEVANATSNSASIFIDGALVGSIYGGNSVNQLTDTYYIKRGQTISGTTGVSGAEVGYTVYGLTFGTQNIFTPQIYSTEEREVGVWIDNKPLYQKTYRVQSLPNASAVEYSLGISDIDSVAFLGCIVENSSIALPLFYNAGNDNGSKIQIYLSDKAAGKVIINTFGDNRSSMSGTVVIQYTKTTDVAGSGQYNTLGVPMVHYTTDEQVVGTYLGKPLYQRVITPIVTASTTLAGDIKYGSVVLGDYINSVDMAFVDLSASYIEPATGATRGLISAYYEKDSGNIVIVTMFTRTNSPSSLCIKYTKITD